MKSRRVSAIIGVEKSAEKSAVRSQIPRNNLALAKQNSELKIKVGRLTQELQESNEKVSLFQIKLASVTEELKRSEFRVNKTEAGIFQARRYFEKLGSSSDLMNQKLTRCITINYTTGDKSISKVAISSPNSKLSTELSSILTDTTCDTKQKTPFTIIREEKFMPFRIGGVLAPRPDNFIIGMNMLKKPRSLDSCINLINKENQIENCKDDQTCIVQRNSSVLAPINKQQNYKCCNHYTSSDKKTTNTTTDTTTDNTNNNNNQPKNLRNGERKCYMEIPLSTKLRRGDSAFGLK